MTTEIKNLSYCQVAIGMKKDMEFTYLKLGEMLYNIREGNLFEPQWSSFGEYIMELKISESTASKIINIYRLFELEYGFPREKLSLVGWTALAETLPFIKSKADAKHWLEHATSLTRVDLKRELIEAKTGVMQRDCSHKNTYMIQVCKDCGDRWLVGKK